MRKLVETKRDTNLHKIVEAVLLVLQVEGFEHEDETGVSWAHDMHPVVQVVIIHVWVVGARQVTWNDVRDLNFSNLRTFDSELCYLRHS